MNEGSAGRLDRLFRGERTVIVAMDHGGFASKPLPGLADPRRTVREVVRQGADGVLAPLGSARLIAPELGDAALVLTLQPTDPATVEAGVETALDLDAVAVKTLVYPFAAPAQHGTGDLLGVLAQLGFECHLHGLGLVAETIPGGWAAGAELRTPEAIAAGARVGAELGADVVKTFGAASAADFEVVARNALVPVVVLGGEGGGDVEALLGGVRASLDGGAAGVAVGRGIWGHADPGAVTAAIAALVHDDATVADALKHVEGR